MVVCLQEHPNIIRCYRCWQDMDNHCINLITEYFTSGNLREYRQKHKHLDSKAVRKWARQVGARWQPRFRLQQIRCVHAPVVYVHDTTLPHL